MDKLKECPFCGGEAETKKSHVIVEHQYMIAYCYSCGARTVPHSSEEGAIEAWNTRPNPWHTGTPTEEGWYLVTYGKDYIYEAVRFKNGRFIATDILRFELMNGNDAYEQEVIDITEKVVAWMPIPPFKGEEVNG